MFIEKELGYKRHWINIDSDIVSEQSYLYTKYDIDQETVEYALDKNERAHMDYNRENGTITFIYNVLALEKDKEYYETIPLTFIVQDTRLVTISNEDNAYVIRKMQDYVDNHENLSIYTLLFAGLEMISNAYYPVIERLDQQKDEVSRRLRQTTTSKNLYETFRFGNRHGLSGDCSYTKRLLWNTLMACNIVVHEPKRALKMHDETEDVPEDYSSYHIDLNTKTATWIYKKEKIKKEWKYK
ncbi:CorA [Streptococcus thermophilus CNCM I-1630]|nr:CorA [Streptococcus thermophilus CNCM I-1630]